MNSIILKIMSHGLNLSFSQTCRFVLSKLMTFG